MKREQPCPPVHDPDANRQDRLLVAIATYNEIQSLPTLVTKIRQVLSQADILIVDDNSPDGTGAWALEQAADDPHIHCLTRASRLGLGTATVAAFSFAIARGYSWLVTMDADGSHDPTALPQMMSAAQTKSGQPVDCVIGSRYVAGGKVVGWPWRRRIASRLLNLGSRIWLGLPTHDNSTAFRMYRIARLQEIGFGSLRSRGYGYLEESLWRLRYAGARMIEVPVVFRDREVGASKLQWRVALRKLWDIFMLRFRRFPRD